MPAVVKMTIDATKAVKSDSPSSFIAIEGQFFKPLNTVVQKRTESFGKNLEQNFIVTEKPKDVLWFIFKSSDI